MKGVGKEWYKWAFSLEGIIIHRRSLSFDVKNARTDSVTLGRRKEKPPFTPGIAINDGGGWRREKKEDDSRRSRGTTETDKQRQKSQRGFGPLFSVVNSLDSLSFFSSSCLTSLCRAYECKRVMLPENPFLPSLCLQSNPISWFLFLPLVKEQESR